MSERGRKRAGTVLVVDADAASREQIASILGEFVVGSVIVLGTVEEGLEAVRAAAADPDGRLDVVLFDLDLWSASGPRLFRAVREADPGSPIPILAMLSHDNENLIDTALQAGATDLMYRPVRPRELAARVHSALAARCERDERSRRERRLAEISRELIDTNRHLERLVCVDSLTGLANRRHLATILGGEWRRAVRTGGEVSVLMIDLDEFHAYNETWGHPGGDTCLRRVAEALAGELRRPSDLLGRYGGEEFLAILPDTTPEGAAVVADRLRAVVESLALAHPRSPHLVVTVSVGAATARADSKADADTIIATADRALFQAKQSGRNCISGDGMIPSLHPARQRKASGSDRWPSPVWMDPVLADRLPAVIDHMRRSVAALGDALAARDASRAASLTSDLRHTAAQYGLDAVDRMTVALDTARTRGDTTAVSQLLGELTWYLAHVPIVYRSRSDPWPALRLSHSS